MAAAKKNNKNHATAAYVDHGDSFNRMIDPNKVQ